MRLDATVLNARCDVAVLLLAAPRVLLLGGGGGGAGATVALTLADARRIDRWQLGVFEVLIIDA